MTTPLELHAAVLDALEAIATVQVFDGDVPAKPPAAADGRVYPYAVAWPGAGTPDPEPDVAAQPRGELAYEERVTVASGSVTWTLQAVQLVRARLHHVEILPGVRLREERLGVPATKDPDTSPVRWYVPLAFRCLTP